MTLIWKGDKVKADLREAARDGVDETTEAAVKRARSSHPMWQDRTGKTSAGIKAGKAKLESGKVVGEIYSDDPHFLFLEIGHHGRKGDRTLSRAADTEGRELQKRIKAALPGPYKS